MVRPRGRPPLQGTVELVKSKSKATKNITVDADLVEILNELADQMSEQLGFRPSLSQALRHLVHKYKSG